MNKLEPGKLLVQNEVKSSSSNNVYQVSIYENCISCNCPAGGSKSLCKHMIQTVHENAELLQQHASEFYNNFLELIEKRKNKGLSKDELKQEYEKLLFVNRQIAEKSHDNMNTLSSQNISKTQECEIFKQFVSKCHKQILITLRNMLWNYRCNKRPTILEINKDHLYLAENGFISITEVSKNDYYHSLNITKKQINDLLIKHNISVTNNFKKDDLIEILIQNDLDKIKRESLNIIIPTERLNDNRLIYNYLCSRDENHLIY